MSATHAESLPATPARRLQEQASATPRAAQRSDQPSRKALWTGRLMSGFAALFILFDLSVKVLKLPVAVESTVQLGYPEGVIVGIGLIEAICLAVYLVPRTSILGAILWTGYLGGAVATHVRVGSPLFSHVLFPIYIAALLWGGLWLRDRRLRTLLFPRAG
jgi:DoxX-like family